MDQSLKQRLVGVVIITALAAIFIPMLFDDPVKDSRQILSELTIPPSPVKAIEREIEPAQTSVKAVLALPGPDYMESELEDVNVQSEKDFGVDEKQQTAQKQFVDESSAEIRQTAGKSEIKQDRQPGGGLPKQQQEIKNQPKLNRWLIQVGIFSTEKNAIALKNKLKEQGFNSFLDYFESKDNKPLYRIRVGPEADKKRALETQAKLEQLNNIKTILRKE